MAVKFNASASEFKVIKAIAERAVSMAADLSAGYSIHEALMDLAATHCNGCPLDLEKLASAPDFDFSHDVFGIRRHLNRKTGQLDGCFLPRCARRVAT